MTKLVFDLGGVLIRWDPRLLLTTIQADPDALQALRGIFAGAEWLALDRGEMDEDEVFQALCHQHPDHVATLEQIQAHWREHLIPIDDHVALLAPLKQQGYPLYVISNFGREPFRFVSRRYPFFDTFDGLLISSDCGLVKPDPAIYRLFLERFQLKAPDCLFIDDREENCDAARDLGMAALHLPPSESLCNRLRELGLLAEALPD